MTNHPLNQGASCLHYVFN